MKESLTQIILTTPIQRFRPWVCEVNEFHGLLNTEIFQNELPTPKFKMYRPVDNEIGWCEGRELSSKNNSACVIGLAHVFPDIQHFIMILAHEMVHQWQWDCLSRSRLAQKKLPIMSHGKSFYSFRDRFKPFYIPLFRAYDPCIDYFKNVRIS